MGKRVGLTGGIGSGKSTVAALFAKHGAVIIDADAIAREVVAPGTPGYDAVIDTFGPDVVREDGSLDRAAVAKIVFGDENRRAELNAIMHPLVGARAAEIAAAAPDDAVVVYDVPLLVEGNMSAGFDAVVVVEAPVDLRLIRLSERGLPEDEARARMKTQATDEQRRAVADEVIVNDGSRDQLADRVRVAWAHIVGRAESGGRTGPTHTEVV